MDVQDFTYAEVGATRNADVPPGYRWLRVRVEIGSGPVVMPGTSGSPSPRSAVQRPAWRAWRGL